MAFKRKLKALVRLWRPRWRRANTAALRLFLRLLPSERRRVFALTILVGVFCGLAAVAFHLGIRAAESQLINRAMTASGRSWVWWTILTPTLGGLLSGALLQYVVPDARGSGIPQVKVAYAIRGGKLSFTHSTVGKFLVGILQIGSGASLGREGPTVQICAGIASLLGRAAALSRDHLRRLLPVGAAAGIAAAFNAPIAAVTFTVEEVVGDLDQTVLSGVIVAAALAAAIERGVLGEHPVFDVPPGYGLRHASSLLLYAALGVAASVVSLFFSESLLKLRGWFRGSRVIPAWMRPAVGGLVTGLLVVAALAWLKTGGVNGGGYDTLSEALSGKIVIGVMLALCALKIVATVFSYASGGAGGLFAPTLFIGGMLGGAFGYLDTALLHHGAENSVGAFALVGMGAVFAGVIRAPITSVLIIFEMTGSYGLILPLMIANMTAYGVARRFRPVPIYDALLEQDGIHLPHKRSGAVAHALEQLRVSEAMTREVFTLPAAATVADALKRISNCGFSTFPLTEDGGVFAGMVSEARLRRTQAEGGGENQVRQIADGGDCVFPDQPLLRAVVHMNRSNVRQLAVVERGDDRRLVGLLTMSDVVRAQARAALDAGELDKTVTPNFSGTKETLEPHRPPLT
ncbi:MAG TPA: chloride channel protein [Pyrinomonadaceae bacterium]|nr:chloride channel protein [Pyrinomonadaceae bacterium]